MKPANILVFRIGHLGDTLVSLPAFWAIRNTYPNAKITLLANADPSSPAYISARSVLPEYGLFDAWMTYPPRTSSARALIEYARLITALRRGKFDAAAYLMPRSRTREQISRDRFFFRAGGIKEVIGTKYLLSNAIPDEFSDEPIEPEWSYLLNCLVAEDFVKRENAAFDLKLSQAETAAANEFLSAKTPNANLIAVAPGSKWESKVWPESRFVETVGRLVDEFGAFPIVFGGSEDREKGERFIGAWQTGANAAGVLNIRQAAAALAECHLYLGNDTGTMHLAAAVNVPCVAVFAAIDRVGRWDPLGNGHKVFRSRVECAGCHSPICLNQEKGKCLDMIAVDAVHAACRDILRPLSSSISRSSQS